MLDKYSCKWHVEGKLDQCSQFQQRSSIMNDTSRYALGQQIPSHSLHKATINTCNAILFYCAKKNLCMQVSTKQVNIASP